MPFFSESTSATLLPPEVLLSIFELATDNSTRDIDRLVDLSPFESIYAGEREKRDKEALKLKHSLTLTCSAFRRVATRLLFEDVWIRHGAEALLKSLQDSRDTSTDGLGLGKFVKRVTLPAEPANEVTSQILSLCPYLRILSRPLAISSDMKNGSNLSGLLFSQLHRIDWAHNSSDEIFALNIAPSFVCCSPFLRSLTLYADDLFILDANSMRDDHQGDEVEGRKIVLVDLPQLHTLRLRTCDALGDPEESSRFSVRLPSLQHIVIERPLALYALHTGILTPYGPQIKTLELGRYSRFLLIDAISISLGYCPNVETFLFPIFSTMPPAKNPEDRPRAEWLEYRVKHIVLNGSVEPDCDYQVSRTWIWVQLSDFVDALFSVRTRFTALERITLHGLEWRELVRQQAFKPIIKAIQSNKVKIDCDDDVTRELVEKMRYQ